LLAELVAHPPPQVCETTIHGDLGLDNVLVHEGRVSALVDWPLGGAGDPRFDLAIAIEHDDEAPYSEAEIAAFWRGHGSPPLDAATLRWFRRLWDFF
jgi:aminoglycoside phosphotransferase (APT) family kinase protein